MGRFFIGRLKSVAIYVYDGSYAGVAQTLRNDFRMHALADKAGSLTYDANRECSQEGVCSFTQNKIHTNQ